MASPLPGCFNGGMHARYYTGIGSRQTPPEVLTLMERLGEALAHLGYTLRSGGATGADSAFERGCDAAGGAKQIFVPWNGYNGRRTGPTTFVGVCPRALELAARLHPAWHRCPDRARALHARNGYQVLGPSLDAPTSFVLCWTKGGSGAGGTGQALRVAAHHGIPVRDLGNPDTLAGAKQWLRALSRPQA